MTDAILKDFGWDEDTISMLPLHQGLINSTWKISSNGHAYILQKINDQVFKNPANIDYNIKLVATHLKKYVPEYVFVAPIKSTHGETLLDRKEEGYYRAFPFVTGSCSKDVVENPHQAYEAARQFGRFTKNLAGIDVSKLKMTIPAFHDLSLRYAQFLTALANGSQKRIKETADLVEELKGWSFIAEAFEDIKKNPEFKLRTTHHDTKISNVLFDKDDNGICVIDLDTVMPGYFFSDVGDMMRTYLSPVSEEENDLSKIEIREAFYEAVVQGYYDEMKDQLTETEKKHFFYSGTFMIYMQAVRFLTDYLNDDVYYGARYPGHNYNRAKNQAQLLKQLYLKQDILEGILVKENGVAKTSG